MIDMIKCREAFEQITLPNFGVDVEVSYRIRRDPNGCYIDPIIEDHWNTFQEGWFAAFSLKNSTQT